VECCGGPDRELQMYLGAPLVFCVYFLTTGKIYSDGEYTILTEAGGCGVESPLGLFSLAGQETNKATLFPPHL
jgi:hypothetical protein